MKTSFHKITTQLFALAVIIAVGTGISGCKKEDDTPTPEPAPAPAPAPLTNTQKLTGKNFKRTAMTVDPGYNTGTAVITDWYAQMKECEKDDLIQFNANGTFIFDESAIKCNPADPQTTSGTWLWNTNETIITATENGQASSYNVLVNDGTTLKYTQTENINGINYVFTVTWTKQ